MKNFQGNLPIKKYKIYSITQNTDFKKAYYRGKYKAHPLVVTYLVKNNINHPRLGITTSKKIGKAHQRNRAKRVLKAAYYENLPQLLPQLENGKYSFDIVLLARADTALKKSTDLSPIIKKHLTYLLSQWQTPHKHRKTTDPHKDVSL